VVESDRSLVTPVRTGGLQRDVQSSGNQHGQMEGATMPTAEPFRFKKDVCFCSTLVLYFLSY
jgi:hypothetical protein